MPTKKTTKPKTKKRVIRPKVYGCSFCEKYKPKEQLEGSVKEEQLFNFFYLRLYVDKVKQLKTQKEYDLTECKYGHRFCSAYHRHSKIICKDCNELRKEKPKFKSEFKRELLRPHLYIGTSIVGIITTLLGIISIPVAAVITSVYAVLLPFWTLGKTVQLKILDKEGIKNLKRKLQR